MKVQSIGNVTLRFASSEGEGIKGGEGRDIMFGSHGDDMMFGGGGNDFLFGGWGNDYLAGGSGDDFPLWWCG